MCAESDDDTRRAAGAAHRSRRELDAAGTPSRTASDRVGWGREAIESVSSAGARTDADVEIETSRPLERPPRPARRRGHCSWTRTRSERRAARVFSSDVRRIEEVSDGARPFRRGTLGECVVVEMGVHRGSRARRRERGPSNARQRRRAEPAIQRFRRAEARRATHAQSSPDSAPSSRVRTRRTLELARRSRSGARTSGAAARSLPAQQHRRVSHSRADWMRARESAD